MTEPFDIIVHYKGRETAFPARLLRQGYSHKFVVGIYETQVYFEPDEEGIYRVVVMPGQNEKELAAIDRQLLGLIQEKLVTVLK